MAQKFPDNTFVAPKLGTGLRLVVAEAPGEDESIQGEPLVGGSGRRFDALCRRAGVRRDELTLANTIQCRPPENNYPLSPDAKSYISKCEAEAAVAQCYKNHVTPLLESRPWRRIDILGGYALRSLCGLDGIFEHRGTVVPIKDLGGKLIGLPTLHPAYIARDQVFSKVVVADLSKTLTLAPEHYNLYPSLEDVEKFTATQFAFDIENDPVTLQIRVVGLSAGAGHAMCVPFRGAYVSQLRRIFNAATVVIGQNSLQHDEPILKLNGVGISPEAQHYDIMLMQHLLMPDLPHDLEFIASIFCHKQAWKSKHNENEELYNCRDTDVTYTSWLQLLPLLRQEGLLGLYENVQRPLARICALMRETGIKADPQRVREVREKLQTDIRRLEGELPAELRSYETPVNKRQPAPEGYLSPKTGKPVKFILVPTTETITPWRSSDFLKTYLYETLALPKQLHPKSGEVTTDKGALDKLFRKTKRPELTILRAIKKLSTLLSGFATDTLAKAEVAHPHFNVHGTASGRLSSSDPNLQNIPESARYLYVPRHPGWEFLQADYSGIENRLTAYLANDTDRLRRFDTIPGYSEHKYAVEVFFGIPYAEVEKDNDKDAPYGKAKRIVHGVNYGMGARKIANTFDMDERECRDLIAKWKSAIGATTRWQEETAKLAKEQGYLVTPFGRKRWFYTDSYYTESLSFIPQSSAADVIYKAMIGLYFERINMFPESARVIAPYIEALPKPVLLVLQIHDALLIEYPREMRDEIAGIVKRVMTQPIPELGGYSFPIEITTGPSWGEQETYNYA